MRPAQGEREEEFVVRIEDHRFRVGLTERDALSHFWPRFSPEFRASLRTLEMVKDQLGRGQELEWEDVVKEARRRVACPNLGPDEGAYTLGGLDPLPVGPPVPGAHAVVRMGPSLAQEEGRGRRGR